MIPVRLARRYALAFFAAAAENDVVSRVGNDLEGLARVLRDDARAREFFLAPVVQRTEKEATLRRAFEGRIHDVALHAVLLLVRKRRERLLDEIVAQYHELERAARRARAVTVTCAREPEARIVEGIVQRLERIYGVRFEAEIRVDPTLIGGIRLDLSDERIDDTIAGRLERLAHVLLHQPREALSR